MDPNGKSKCSSLFHDRNTSQASVNQNTSGTMEHFQNLMIYVLLVCVRNDSSAFSENFAGDDSATNLIWKTWRMFWATNWINVVHQRSMRNQEQPNRKHSVSYLLGYNRLKKWLLCIKARNKWDKFRNMNRSFRFQVILWNFPSLNFRVVPVIRSFQRRFPLSRQSQPMVPACMPVTRTFLLLLIIVMRRFLRQQDFSKFHLVQHEVEHWRNWGNITAKNLLFCRKVSLWPERNAQRRKGTTL